MKIFYHGDMDGIVSAAILLDRIIPRSATKDNALVYEFDYNNQSMLEDLDYDRREDVYFVDCSPDKTLLDDIIEWSGRVFIIDHHISKKEMLEEYYEENLIDGMFYNGASASLITYCWASMIVTGENTIQEVKDFLDWFGASRENQEKSDIPLSIKLVNSWDIWNGLYIDAEPFKIAFESKRLHPKNKEIMKILSDNRSVTNTITEGYIMQKQIQSWAETFMQRYGYEVELEGNKFFVANLGNGNSKYFGDRIKDYDAVITYCYNGSLWTFSIYSNADKDFDCSIFAIRFNGGGHKKAAGFRMKDFPNWLKSTKEGSE